MEQKAKDALKLLQEYCRTFNLKGTGVAATMEPWVPARGKMLAAGFLPDDDGPPVAWVTATGELFFEQDEDLLQPHEPAVASLEETVVRVAINNKRPIHPTS